ncbi:MAG: T9SS type A sorting domain-containing protein [Bacteroidota bacterium]
MKRTILILSFFFPFLLTAQINGTFSPIGNDGILPNTSGFVIDPQGSLLSGGCETLHTFDGTDWVPIHSVFNGNVNVVAFDSQGDLFVSGDFDTVAGIPIQHIAQWNGNNWSGLGAGLNQPMDFLEFDGQDHLFAAQKYGTEVIRWDGNNWDTLDGEIFIGISALAVSSQGHVYAGGFDYSGAGYANILNHWNGTDWDTLIHAANYVGGYINTIKIDEQGNVYVGGDIENIAGLALNNIGKWDGNNWDNLGGGLPNDVSAIEIDDQGRVYAGGSFFALPDIQSRFLTRWDGNVWSSLGSGINGRADFLQFDEQGNLYTLGTFEKAGNVNVNGIAKWANNSWSAVGKGGFPDIRTVNIAPNGHVFMTGYFFTLFGDEAQTVGMWDGNSWQDRGANLYPEETFINQFAFGPQNQVYGIGYFESYGQDSTGEFLGHIAQWTGSQWDSLGGGLGDIPSAITVDQNNHVYVYVDYEGTFKWDDSSWNPINANLDGGFYDLQVDAEGNIYGAGTFSLDGMPYVEGVAKYDGTVWTQIGGEMNQGAYSLAISANGTLYVGGDFSLIGTDSIANVAQWNGTSWEALGDEIEGDVSFIAIDATGFLYAGGHDISVAGHDPKGFAIWDGSTWLSPLFDRECIGDQLFLMRPHPNGFMLLAGEFAQPYPLLTFWKPDSQPNAIGRTTSEIILSVFPNPSSGRLIIESPEASIQSIRLFDFTGRELPSSIELHRHSATVRTNYSGLSLVTIQTTKGSVVKKIVFE